MQAKTPSFIQRYAVGETGYIDLFSHRPISGVIAQNFIKTQLPLEDFFTIGAGFWILEGFVHEVSLPEESYPSLNYYLEMRSDKEMPRRFELYKALDESELNILIEAYNATRRHVLETQADTPLEEKKIES